MGLLPVLLFAVRLLGAPLPFSSDELDRAAAARGIDASGVEVWGISAGQAVVRLPNGKTRIVELGGHRRGEAARLVALGLSDLLLEDIAPVPMPVTEASFARSRPGGVMVFFSPWVGMTIDKLGSLVTLAGGVDAPLGDRRWRAILVLSERLPLNDMPAWTEIRPSLGFAVGPLVFRGGLATGIGASTARLGAAAGASYSVGIGGELRLLMQLNGDVWFGRLDEALLGRIMSRGTISAGIGVGWQWQ